MYLKVEKGTKLFDKLRNLGDRIFEANNAAIRLGEELGFEKVRGENFMLAGGIGSLFAKSKPKGYAYAFGAKHPKEFLPKKTNKEVWDKINALPKITYKELNDLINYDGHKSSRFTDNGGKVVPFTPGISFSKNSIGIDIPDYVEYTPVEGMVEITYTEYKNIK